MEQHLQKSSRLLIIEDDQHIVNLLSSGIPEPYFKEFAASAEAALDFLQKSDHMPDLILLDTLLPGMSSCDLCRELKGNPRYNRIPLILLSLDTDSQTKVDALNNGCADFVTKPFNLQEIMSRIDVHLSISRLEAELDHQNKYLNRLVDEKANEISEIQFSTIYALVKLTEYRDDTLGGHLNRIQVLCGGISDKLQKQEKYKLEISPEFIDNIFKASPLHDIGKVGINDAIYLKPGKLTFEEFEMMKKHTSIGAETLNQVLRRFPNNAFIRMGISLAQYHHEKWDGTGYPEQLSGEAIPLCARIMAVADVFDALTSKRPYKEAFSYADSYRIIEEGRGTHFDPMVVDAFIEFENEVIQIDTRC